MTQVDMLSGKAAAMMISLKPDAESPREIPHQKDDCDAKSWCRHECVHRYPQQHALRQSARMPICRPESSDSAAMSSNVDTRALA
jgi:hypothetical protein